MFCFKNKFNLLIIILSFKKQGLGDTTAQLSTSGGTGLFTQQTICAANSLSASTEASLNGHAPRFLKLKTMINKLNLFVKQNIHQNIIQILFIIDKIVRIDIFINKPNSTI